MLSDKAESADADGASPPMLAQGDCPHCGFAITRGLDRFCPRCGQAPDASPAKVRSEPPPFARPLPRPKIPSAAPYLAVIGTVCGATLLAIAVAVMLHNPHRRALSAYGAGVALHLGADYELAISRYRDAVTLDPNLPAPYFAAGMACIKIGARDHDRSAIQALLNSATWGHTQNLDSADGWFQAAILRCDTRPGGASGDSSLGDAREVKSLAQAYLGFTALVRAAAALEAGKADQYNGWRAVAQGRATEATRTDPTNPVAESLRDALAKLSPL